jgi:polyketide cyclase/dehydrase/lipid transport protein
VAAPFRFDRTWEFPVAPDRLWAVLERTEQYPSWWSWLREFEADGFTTGTEARFVIQSPLPYALRCTLTIDEMRASQAIVTTVSGDLCGPARLEIAPTTDGCAARLVWSLSPGTFVLKQLALIGRPAMVWAHDRVVAVGVEQFRRRAIVPARDLQA